MLPEAGHFEKNRSEHDAPDDANNMWISQCDKIMMPKRDNNIFDNSHETPCGTAVIVVIVLCNLTQTP